MDVLTKWHKAKDCILNKRLAVNVGTSKTAPITDLSFDNPLAHAVDYPHLVDLISLANNVPKFYLTPDIVDFTLEDKTLLSLEHMVDAGMARLPFRHVIVEYDVGIGDVSRRHFILLTERETSAEDYAEIERLAPVEQYPWVATVMRIAQDTKGDYLSLAPAKFYVNFSKEVPIDPDDHSKGHEFGFVWATMLAPYLYDVEREYVHRAIEATAEKDSRIINIALSAMIVMMRTKGVGKESVDPPEKLNKSRQKSGKSKIQPYTVIKIGSYYSKDGKEHKYDEHAKRHVRVHWRRGHWRNVAHGPGHKLRKPMWFDPVLVNYEGGDEPVPEFKVTV